jgi:hypothetical protein
MAETKFNSHVIIIDFMKGRDSSPKYKTRGRDCGNSGTIGYYWNAGMFCEILNITNKNVQKNISCNVNVPRGIMGNRVKLIASYSPIKAVPDSRNIYSHYRLLIVSLLC